MSQIPDAPTHEPMQAFRAALESQYHAALAMLGDVIERCPDDLWLDDRPTNAFWQVAYHALHFTHLYLQPKAEAFEPWEGHVANVQHEDGIPGRADPKSDLPLVANPYTREQALAYWRHCVDLVDAAVDALDLASPESGFSWYPISKLEHQLVNLRHLQHHTAQLADRLRNEAGLATRWVGSRRAGARRADG